EQFAEVLVHHGRDAATPVALGQEASTGARRSLRTTLAKVAEGVRQHESKPPAVVLIGPVAGLRGARARAGSARHSWRAEPRATLPLWALLWWLITLRWPSSFSDSTRKPPAPGMAASAA